MAALEGEEGVRVKARFMTILVTGGAGFIGSHLCRRLLETGARVICLDDLSTGRYQFIEPLLSHPNFTFVTHNIIQPYIPSEKIDQIYNLASPASPPRCLEYPLTTLKTSVLGVLNLLDLALEQEAVFLQASTSEVYGDPQQHPQKEDYWGNVNPIGPRACYDEAKRCAETTTMIYKERGVKVKIVRIFNTYGPRMAIGDGRVIVNFINQALKGEPLTVYGQGNQTRSFCYVSDLVEGLLRLMNHPTFSGPVNIGNPHEVTIKELAEMIIKLTGSKSQLEYRPLPVDDPKRRCPDISLAQKVLGWQPRVDLISGLKKTIEYFRRLKA